MRIGIDARFYGSCSKGLGRYTQKLIENLEKIYKRKKTLRKKDQFFIFLRKENFAEYQPRNKNFHKVLADYKWYTFSEQINMPRLLNKYNLDLAHFPHFNVPIFYRKKFIVTIHDLILLHFPTIRGTTLNPFLYQLKFLAYKIAIGKAIKKSQKIIAVSKFTKNDILDNYSISPNKIIVTYESGNSFAEQNNFGTKVVTPKVDEKILKRYGIIKPYLLYVGNAYPHKNLERMARAWKIFKEKRKDKLKTKLVLVGKSDYFYDRLQETVKKEKIKDIIFAGFVKDDDLDAIYQKAMAYVFPSLYEGFGLPPLEAMKNGVPIISSDHQCMKEILGEAVYFFNAKSEENIARAMDEIITNKGLRKKLINDGYKQLLKYSWYKMAKQTLRVYKK